MVSYSLANANAAGAASLLSPTAASSMQTSANFSTSFFSAVNNSIMPFLLNAATTAMIPTAADNSGGNAAAAAGEWQGEEQEEEQYDGNVMNRPMVKTFFLMAYIMVFVSCVVGNSMILICIVCNRSMRTVTNFFLANLAIADLLVGIFCVCQNAAHFVLFAHGTWPFGRALCHAYVYILHMIPNSSAGILVLLSVERFIAVLRPMLVHHLMTKSVLNLCTLLVWTLSALMNIPYLIAVQYMEFFNPEANQYYGICTRRHLLWSDINVLQLVSTVNLMVWYVLPLTLLFSIYVSIGLVLIKTTDDDSVARTSQVHHHQLQQQQQQQRWSPSSSNSHHHGGNAALLNGTATASSGGGGGMRQKYSLLLNGQQQQQQQSAICQNGMAPTPTIISSSVRSYSPRKEQQQQQQQQHKFSEPAMCNPNRKVSQPVSQQIRRLSTQLLNRTNSNCADLMNGNGQLTTTTAQIRKLPKIELVDSRRRVIRLCAVIVLAFAVLSLPRYIYLTWSVWREANAPRCLNCLSALVQPTTFLLMFLASGINPILYAFLSQRFRAAIRDTFSFRKGREQRKEQMMLLLRNHRLSEQMERDALGAPIVRTLSSNGCSSQNNGGGGTSSYRLKHQQRRGSHQTILESANMDNHHQQQQQQQEQGKQTPKTSVVKQSWYPIVDDVVVGKGNNKKEQQQQKQLLLATSPPPEQQADATLGGMTNKEQMQPLSREDEHREGSCAF